MEETNSANRVSKHTAPHITDQIRSQTVQSIRSYANRTPGEIDERLQALDREWDIERAIEANAAAISLAGVSLAAFVDKRWLLLPAAVGGFLLQHAIQGWCPPVPVLRRMGFRTPYEIEEERYALKLMKGDFDRLVSKEDVDAGEIHSVMSH